MGFNKYLGIGLALIFGLVGLTMFFQIAASTIPTAASAYYDLATGYNTTVMGEGPTAIAASSTSWMGYLWILLPFAVGIAFIVKLIKK